MNILRNIFLLLFLALFCKFSAFSNYCYEAFNEGKWQASHSFQNKELLQKIKSLSPSDKELLQLLINLSKENNTTEQSSPSRPMVYIKETDYYTFFREYLPRRSDGVNPTNGTISFFKKASPQKKEDIQDNDTTLKIGNDGIYINKTTTIVKTSNRPEETVRTQKTDTRTFKITQNTEDNSIEIKLKETISQTKKSYPKDPRRSSQMKAVMQIKTAIEELVQPEWNLTITAIPSSKLKNHPLYDKRFELLFRELLKSKPNLIIEWPIKVKKTTPASYKGSKQTPEFIKNNYLWTGFQGKTPEIIYIIDDVVTTGAHFRAVSDFMRENGYKGLIVGIFMAKTVYSILE